MLFKGMLVKIVNGLTGTSHVLKTKNSNAINWYACGPTVYDDAHIGHARTLISQDVVRRILERAGYSINLQMGITDIDDKIIERAKRVGRDWKAISNQYESSFIKTMKRLGVKMPSFFSRVSDNIPNIIKSIDLLLGRGFAYRLSDGSIYFDIDSYKKSGFTYPKFPCGISDHEDKLSGKKNPRDFALWKAAKSLDEPSWEAFGGRGRPGWHIECSAMIWKGLQDIDLHTGGIDLRFPHHENEIAQSEAMLGTSPWCPQFIHFGHVKFGGEKMSKSLKNFVTVNSFLESYDASTLRMLFLQKRYEQDFEFSDSLIQSAQSMNKSIERFKVDLVLSSEQNISSSANPISENELALMNEIDAYTRDFENALTENFDTPKAINIIFSIQKLVLNFQQTASINPVIIERISDRLLDHLSALGMNHLNQSEPINVHRLSRLIEFRAAVRSQALKSKDFRILSLCDELRDELKSQNITVKDEAIKM